MSELYRLVKEKLRGPNALILSLKPLALSEQLAERLRKIQGPVDLVTADLSSPIQAWSETRLGRKNAERCTWHSLASLGQDDPALSAAAAQIRTVLPCETVLASPTLSPVLQELLDALGRARQNPQNWVFRTKGGLDGVLEGLNTGLGESFRLKVSPDGLQRWPALDPGESLADEARFSKHARILMIPASEVSAFCTHLASVPPLV